MPSPSVFWEKMQRSAAPVALLSRKLGEEHWAEEAERVFKRFRKALGDGPIEERYTSHLGVGVK